MPGGVWHRRVARCDSTVPRQYPSPVRGCGTPVATAPPRTVSRVQARVATNRDILLRPGLGEGHNNVLKRGRCASLLCGAVRHRSSSSLSQAGG